jgi:hypothetical protein
MLAFYDQNYKLVATADIVDGELVSTVGEDYIKRLSGKMSPEQFIEKFKDFNNGYTRVLTFAEGETPDAELIVHKKQFPDYKV